jgi:ribosomal protein S18 acetylase RimI-like enzyme
MNVIIRSAATTDVSVIAEFNSAIASETENLELNYPRLLQGVQALLADSTKGMYYIAEINGIVVGQLMITNEWSDWRNATFWWIQSVYVKKEFRKQGVFRSLYQYVESLARSRGDVCGLRLYVETQNDHAQKTYEALGMHHSHYQMMEETFFD